VTNCPHVCLEHRYVARGHVWGSRYCPVDGARLIKFSTRTKIPKKTDDLGWRRLRAMYQKSQRRAVEADYARNTRQPLWEVQMRMRRAERALAKWRR
jgi:hypothetical protein